MLDYLCDWFVFNYTCWIGFLQCSKLLASTNVTKVHPKNIHKLKTHEWHKTFANPNRTRTENRPNSNRTLTVTEPNRTRTFIVRFDSHLCSKLAGCLVIYLAVGCSSFLPGSRLSSHCMASPFSGHYQIIWHRGVNYLPKVTVHWYQAGSWTLDLLITNSTLYQLHHYVAYFNAV